MNNKTRNIVIFAGQPAKPEVIESGNYRATIIHAPDPADAAKQTAKLASEGIDRVELCGGTGVKWLADIQSAISKDIPVGLVTYPFESLTQIAAFKSRFESENSGVHEGEAFIFLTGEGKPERGRIVQNHDSGWTIYTAAKDDQEAVNIAGELAKEGATLIELYGGFDLNTAAKVIDKTNGEIPVGVAAYGWFNESESNYISISKSIER